VISLIPVSDSNPTRRFPIITVILIVLNVVAFFQTPGLGSGGEAAVYFYENAPLPCQIESDCPSGVQFGEGGPIVEVPERTLAGLLGSIIFSTFLHGGFLHIAGNMLFLWVFGNNIEDFLGRLKYVLFYLAGGIAASLAHMYTHLDDVIPSVGASGAVAAVMGAYLLLYPKARVKTLVIFIFITMIELSALAVLVMWFIYQFFIGAQELSGATEVAWMAHVGGFVFGFVGILLLGGRPHLPPAQRRFAFRA
jgi:membrane associated rhomboid family serine protease